MGQFQEYYYLYLVSVFLDSIRCICMMYSVQGSSSSVEKHSLAKNEKCMIRSWALVQFNNIRIRSIQNGRERERELQEREKKMNVKTFNTRNSSPSSDSCGIYINQFPKYSNN